MDFSRGLQGLLNLNAFDMHASVDDPRDKTTGFADESAHHFYVQDVVPETSAGVRTNTNREQGTSIVQVEVALVRLLSFVVSMEEKAKSKDQSDAWLTQALEIVKMEVLELKHLWSQQHHQLHGDYSFGGARKGYQEDLASLYFNLLQETKRDFEAQLRQLQSKALGDQNLKHEREKGLLESIKDSYVSQIALMDELHTAECERYNAALHLAGEEKQKLERMLQDTVRQWEEYLMAQNNMIQTSVQRLEESHNIELDKIRSTPTKIEKGSAMFDVDTLIRQQNIIEFEFNSEFRSHKFGASKRFLNFTMPHRQDKGLLSSPSGQTESMVNNIQRTPSLDETLLVGNSDAAFPSIQLQLEEEQLGGIPPSKFESPPFQYERTDSKLSRVGRNPPGATRPASFFTSP
uniref:Uncharacterized protein n=1 Tax=Hanusia phi TaxID=3032 RepID=A0A7S0DTW1_9CRYP|mmetsp:Transcript_100/g.274  ORF Transcript_100/g.274 Transcript_100/m.274 type:complete len:405 (+) Transcript_100:55-1269(+)